MGGMVKLKRLKIEKFRNVEPVELEFSDDLNVCLGINGSGKTTFLNLIVAILNRDFLRLDDEDEEFSIEYGLDLGVGILDISLKNEPRPPKAVPARRGHPAIIGKSEYRLRAKIRIDASPWRELPDELFETFVFTWGLPTLQHTEAVESLEWLSRFDESTDFFSSLRSSASAITTLGDQQSPSEGLLLMNSRQPVSSALMAWLKNESRSKWSGWREPQSFRVSMTRLPFLAKMVELAGLKDGWIDFRLLHTSQEEGRSVKDMRFGQLEFWFERRDGSRVQDEKLSHGQKRLLSFLYYLDCNPHIVVADELTNGLHHAWITACIEAIGNRQSFLANQDPLLVDELEFSSPADVKRAFILCRCDTSSGKERLIWSHMSDEDAARFFEAYQVGLQHVSEILRAKNLW